MRPDTLAVIGLGAMGGSVAWQARRAGIPRVIGYARSRADAVQALKSAAIHDAADSAAAAIHGAELVVLATPPQAIPGLLREVVGAAPRRALVTDIASVKAPLIRWADEAGLASRYAGSHPFVGTHVGGWAGASPDLFRGALVYVADTGPQGETAALEVMDFWRSVMEAEPVRIPAEQHDEQLGWTSHLPQAVAGALTRAVGGRETLRGATWGRGIRDCTRIAASPPDAWVDVLLLNRQTVVDGLRSLEAETALLRDLLVAGDRAAILEWLSEASAIRRAIDHDPGAGGSVVERGPPR